MFIHREMIRHVPTCERNDDVNKPYEALPVKICPMCMYIRFLFEMHVLVCATCLRPESKMTCWLPGCSVGGRVRMRRNMLERMIKEDDWAMYV